MCVENKFLKMALRIKVYFYPITSYGNRSITALHFLGTLECSELS